MRRKDRRGVDPISDALTFGKLWYTEPNAVTNAIGYAQSMAFLKGKNSVRWLVMSVLCPTGLFEARHIVN
jgi:hypothetical protein